MIKRWKHNRASTTGKTYGLTFLEVLLVISLIATLFVLAAPRFKGVHLKNQLKTTTREMARLMRLGRAEAVYSGMPVEFSLHVDEHWYEIKLPPPTEEEEKKYRGRDKQRSEVEERHELPIEVAFRDVSTDAPPNPEEQRIARIIFYPNGTATGATVVLINERGKTMTIDLAGSTAIPRVYVGAPDEG
jgi:Tfp pilus assembly protein FimT